MTLALWCLFFAATLHFFSKLPLGAAQVRGEGSYDNSDPRAQQARLTGWGRRAKAAHENQIESFPLFAAGVLVATVAAPRADIVGWLALAHVVARVAYLFLYLADLAAVRSLVWTVGFFSSLALLCSPAWL